MNKNKMSKLSSQSSLSIEEIDENFKDFDVFEGIMVGLVEAREHAMDERRRAWAFAEGLSQVDDLETSPEFKELREREIRGEITTAEMRAALTEKYEAASSRLLEKNQEAYRRFARGE